ncbi:hypothetical protein DBR17_17875 [Sphingomonas sp. HMWF008]|nr:hypothetical protein DBR17_17875 [Sphingomonas sp. HMWF008]
MRLGRAIIPSGACINCSPSAKLPPATRTSWTCSTHAPEILQARVERRHRHSSRMDAPTKLSANFALEELLVSDTARKHGIANTPTPEHLANIKRYLVPGLEAIRTLVGGKPVRSHSAYRNPAVNALVGGTPTSAHPLGFADDITVEGLGAEALARIIAKAMTARLIRIDQLILESGRGVVHVSFDPRARGMRGHQPRGAGTPINWRFFG